jgi:alkanesulfonate monooxygenase SsuD/methylene tetrahydromethanopterin reductase-like flavin-dependent oxidoreductase (luciferase family)
MINVLVLRGADETNRAWAAYRQARAEAGLPKVGTDHFAYAALVYVGDTHEAGVGIGSKLLWFLNTSLKSAPQFGRFLPGTVPPPFAPEVYRTAKGIKPSASGAKNNRALIGINAAEAMERGILFAGSPDTVYQQIMDFYGKVGGFDNLVMVGHSGFMTHTEAEQGIKRFAREVLPRLKEIAPVPV